MAQPTPAYAGLELGPIRPPSEAQSLLVRVTRNCPWNRCTFCPVYKGATFSRRPLDHVLRDIDTLRDIADSLLTAREKYGTLGPERAAYAFTPEAGPTTAGAYTRFTGSSSTACNPCFCRTPTAWWSNRSP